MDLIRLSISAKFVSERISLSWREVRFGIANDLIDRHAVVDLATERLAAPVYSSPALVELAGVSGNEQTRALVDQLADAEAEQGTDQIRDKWLYLVLAWIYEHRGDYKDPLQAVEEVYADFGYPEHVVGLVRYMPTDEPDLGSRQANEGRLVDQWKQYLDEASKTYGAHE